MTEDYGDILPETALSGAVASMVFESGMGMSWADCGTTAEFLGLLFSGLAVARGHDGNDARHSISYLANELLENAVKFRLKGAGAISLDATLDGGVFMMRLSNHAEAANAQRFRQLLELISSRDAGELLLERIEANALADGDGGSGLGILTMMNDYGARMGWRFEQDGADADVRVETHAALALA